MNITLQAMQPVVRGANIVSKVEDVHLHMRLFLKESCQELESTTLTLGRKDPKVTILVCKCKRPGCLAATQVPEKGMNVHAPAFFTGWLRGLGWKRLLLRSDNERALLAFLRAAAASLEGVEVIEQASPDHAANGLAEVGVREVKAQTRVLMSHLEEGLKR